MQNTFKKLGAFLCLLALLITQANAKSASCEWLEGGGATNFAFIKEANGRIFHLMAESRSWHWKSYALGYHTMMIECRTCFFGPSASATHTFFQPKKHSKNPM